MSIRIDFNFFLKTFEREELDVISYITPNFITLAFGLAQVILEDNLVLYLCTFLTGLKKASKTEGTYTSWRAIISDSERAQNRIILH